MEGACISASVRRDGSLPMEHLQELEQQPERIPIGGHGFWTDPSMGNQMLGEEILQKWSGQRCGWGRNHLGSPPSP